MQYDDSKQTDDVIEGGQKIASSRNLESSKRPFRPARMRLGAGSTVDAVSTPEIQSLKYLQIPTEVMRNDPPQSMFTPLTTRIVAPQTPSTPWSMDSHLKGYDGKILESNNTKRSPYSFLSDFAQLSFEDPISTPLSVERCHGRKAGSEILYGETFTVGKLTAVPEIQNPPSFSDRESSCDSKTDLQPKDFRGQLDKLPTSLSLKSIFNKEYSTEEDIMSERDSLDTSNESGLSVSLEISFVSNGGDVDVLLADSKEMELFQHQSILQLLDEDSPKFDAKSWLFNTGTLNISNEADTSKDEFIEPFLDDFENSYMQKTRNSSLSLFGRIGENVTEVFRESKSLSPENIGSEEVSFNLYTDAIQQDVQSTETKSSNDLNNLLNFLSLSDEGFMENPLEKNSMNNVTEIYHNQSIMYRRESQSSLETSFSLEEDKDHIEIKYDNSKNVKSIAPIDDSIKVRRLGSLGAHVSEIFRSRESDVSSIAIEESRFNIYTDSFQKDLRQCCEAEIYIEDEQNEKSTNTGVSDALLTPMKMSVPKKTPLSIDIKSPSIHRIPLSCIQNSSSKAKSLSSSTPGKIPVSSTLTSPSPTEAWHAEKENVV